jgi:hypothetical protein
VEPERTWRKPRLRFAIWLFGTGLGILLAIPVSMLTGPALGLRTPLVLAWASGVAATYGLVALGLKAPARRIGS